MRPRDRCALISSRIRGSNSTSSFGKLIEMSLCLRLMELSSTVNLNPSFAVSPRPYPVIDLMQSSQFQQSRHLADILVASTAHIDNHDGIPADLFRILHHIRDGVCRFERGND